MTILTKERWGKTKRNVGKAVPTEEEGISARFRSEFRNEITDWFRFGTT
jgi:hypothetical protein